MHSGAPLRLETQVAPWHPPHFAALHTDLPRPLAAQPGRYEGDADAYNVRPTLGLSTAVIPHSALHLACTEGITLVELFGGLAAGLEMFLARGVRVLRYLYCDTDIVARAVANHRCNQLSQQYPNLFSTDAWEDMFRLPQDVRLVTTADLMHAGVMDDTQWAVVAGWECQDLSSAGSCQGLTGLHSSTFFDLLRVMGSLQQLQHAKPPLYLLENVSLQHNHSSAKIREQTYPFVCAAIGVPLVFDACQVGSYAHRLRAYWTNMGDSAALQCLITSVVRRPSQIVQEILLPWHRPQPITRSDQPPYYPANIYDAAKPRPRAAFPTLMAHPTSYAFRNDGPGTILNAPHGDLRNAVTTQLHAEERERCMGYSTDTTKAQGVSEAQRRAMLGRAMDSNALKAIFSAVLHLHNLPPEPSAAVCVLGGEGVGNALSESKLSSHIQQPVYTFSQLIHADAHPYMHMVMVAEAAEETRDVIDLTKDVIDLTGTLADIHDDSATLTYLRDKQLPSEPREQRRVLRRSLAYTYHPDGFLYRILPDGSHKQVPHPARRSQLVLETHTKCGHYGQKRTRSLLLSSFWWKGMSADISQVLNACQACSRSNATFNTPHPTLHPIPVVGLFYRWNVDLCGPFPTSKAGYKYVLVCIESLSKHVEAIPLRSKESPEVAAAFLTHVIGRFGSCAEVLSDQGGEFQGVFHALLTSCLIDHRLTSPNHPQANGLSERCVQTIKRALRKLTDDAGHAKDWEKHLPWLVLGYLCSVQRSTGFSPYHLLYATAPVIPPAIRERMHEPIDFDNPDLAAASLLSRAAIVKNHLPMALGNLEIAQHRDTLRYATIKGGAFIPKLRRFQEGDYVYVRRRNRSDTLQFSSHPEILRVREVLPQGTLRLYGQCGQEITMHCTNCTPCHLLNINPTLNPSLARPNLSHKCEICRSAERSQDMVLCTLCNSGWHMFCLQPVMTSIPSTDWFCPICIAADRHPLPPTLGPLSPAAPGHMHSEVSPSLPTSPRRFRQPQRHSDEWLNHQSSPRRSRRIADQSS